MPFGEPPEFDRRVIAITGGSSGIGLATARLVLRRGGRVAILARGGQRLEAASQLLATPPIDPEHIIAIQGNACIEAAVEHFIGETVRRHGRLDGVVACAGSVQRFDLLTGSIDQWRRMIDANVTASFIAARVAGSRLAVGGSIVLLGSLSPARSGATVAIPYAVAKSGVPVLNRAFAVAFAPRGIRVNAVVPGWVDTPMSMGRNRTGDRSAEGADSRRPAPGRVPLGRFADPQEIAEVIAFALSTRASFVTGSELLVDGGELASFGTASDFACHSEDT